MPHCLECLTLTNDITCGFEEMAGGLHFSSVIALHVGLISFTLLSGPFSLSHVEWYCFLLRLTKLSSGAMPSKQKRKGILIGLILSFLFFCCKMV